MSETESNSLTEKDIPEWPDEALTLEEENKRLRFTLYRIAMKDRHTRNIKPNREGGFRGVGGMLASYALTGVNGSFLTDEDIAEKHPDLEQLWKEWE